MKNLFYLSVLTLLFISCSETKELFISEEQKAIVTESILEFDQMSANESPFLRAKLAEFYIIATPQNCEIENFPDVITPEDVSAYVTNIGHSLRSLHDWSVNYGFVIKSILEDNPEWNRHALIDELLSSQFIKLKRTANNCELQMHVTFTRNSLLLADSFDASVAFEDEDGLGTINIVEPELMAFGGALNTFVRVHDLLELCSESEDLSK